MEIYPILQPEVLSATHSRVKRRHKKNNLLKFSYLSETVLGRMHRDHSMNVQIKGNPIFWMCRYTQKFHLFFDPLHVGCRPNNDIVILKTKKSSFRTPKSRSCSNHLHSTFRSYIIGVCKEFMQIRPHQLVPCFRNRTMIE